MVVVEQQKKEECRKEELTKGAEGGEPSQSKEQGARRTATGVERGLREWRTESGRV
jgi:hypothetical protein